MGLINKLLSLNINQTYEITEDDLEDAVLYQNNIPETGIQLYCNECKETRTFNLNTMETHNSMLHFINRLASISKTTIVVPFRIDDPLELKIQKKKEERIQKFKNFKGDFVIYLYCPICHDFCRIWFNYSGHELTKVAEYPSQLDGLKDQYSKYKKLKSNDFDYRIEFITGIYVKEKCNSGIGSFAYMRRCLENCVYEYINEDLNNNIFTKDQLNEATRFQDKIELVKDHFDECSLEYIKPLYSILSKGIHELKEEECIKNFNLIKELVSYLLDEKYEKIVKAEKIQKMKDSLNNITK